METQILLLKDLVVDSCFQSRIGINKDVVNEYGGLVADGVPFPPIQVVKANHQLIVVDGFHRIEAYRSIGRDRIEARVQAGDRSTALRLAIQANQGHGQRLSRQDKRRCVEMALDDFELSCLSDREIARLCGVSNTLVSQIRQEGGHTKSQSKFARKTHSKSEPQVSMLTPGREEDSVSVERYENDDIDPRDELLQSFVRENELLNDRLAVAAMDATEEEKALAGNQLKELREKVRILEIQVDTLTLNRDRYLNENSQLIRQCNMQRGQIKRLNAQLAKRAEIEKPH